MPLYLGETRATTHRVVAAIDGFIGRLLCGPRQHEGDLLSEPGRCHPASLREGTGEGGWRC